MKIKKILMDDKGTPSLAAQRKEDWVMLGPAAEEVGDTNLAAVSSDLISFLQHRDRHRQAVDEVIDNASRKTLANKDMPEEMLFNPVLYRDFMLCERHAVNSGRGMIKNCLPKIYPILKVYEFITGAPFPAIKPKKAYYENPVYYKGNHLSFVGSGSEVVYPDYATLWDYELELGMIITKQISNADENTALSAIGAFCVFNDFSARNVQIPEMRQTGFGPCKSKDFASALSNVAVTADEVLPDLSRLEARVIINGNTVAGGRLNDFLFSLGQAVSYASRGETIYPGEFMASGTIPDCCGLENGRLLADGDTIRLEIDRIGFVENRVRQA